MLNLGYRFTNNNLINKYFHNVSMAGRGRPLGSKIRQNLVELLFYVGKGYGYELHKLYCQIFPECTREVIYYHLKKGVSSEEFKLEQVKIETGNYSWGNTVRKLVYSLGSSAKPIANDDVLKKLKELKIMKD